MLEDFASGAAGFALHDQTDGKAAVASTQSLTAATASAEGPAGSAPALRVAATIAAGFKYLVVVHRDAAQATLDGHPAALGVWARADGDLAMVSCRLQDSSGEVFQPTPARLDHDWQYVELRFAGPETRHWGGNSDGVIDWPARWQALLLVDRDHQRPYQGELHVAHPALIYEL